MLLLLLCALKLTSTPTTLDLEFPRPSAPYVVADGSGIGPGWVLTLSLHAV